MYLEYSRSHQSVYKGSLPSCSDSSPSNSPYSTFAFLLSLAWLLTISLACGLGSAQVVVVAEAWLTTPHALIGCSQSEPRPDENLSSDLQKTLSNSSLFTLHLLWHNLMLKVGRTGFDPQLVERVGYIEVCHFLFFL
jgi:hypothetical protein